MSAENSTSSTLSARQREELFVRLAKRESGVTAQDAFEAGRQLGDSVTIEAYHNLGRRLTHRGVFQADKTDRHTRYSLAPHGEGQWLDEDQLAAIVDPEYPLIALTVFQEATRQLNTVPESAWIEIRERLKGADARQLFAEAIVGYCQNLRDEIENYVIEKNVGGTTAFLATLRQRIENEISTLRGLVHFGLGLSVEAVRLPANFQDAVVAWEQHGASGSFVNEEELRDELSRRIENVNLVVEVEQHGQDPNLLVAAVDGSSRSGLLSPDGEQGDFSIGSFPLVSINTAVAQLNRSVKAGDTMSAAFLRLPEKPEDMQQSDNRHTIMAKLFYPDITDGEYIHSVWNAMDVVEARATLRVLRRWYTSRTNVEVRPADIVLRDGTVVPQERDFSHYIQQDSYGKIARDLIDLNWEVVKKCRDDDQTVAGVVKNANLRVVAPVVNWFVCKLLGTGEKTQVESWPLQAMNLASDQLLLTRLLTAGRQKDEPWTRTAVVLRPFHSVTRFSKNYSKRSGKTPAEIIIQRASEPASSSLSLGSDFTWLRGAEFRKDRDAYVQMLRNCWYASTYIGFVPRLDLDNTLPRCEFVLPVSTAENGQYPAADAMPHIRRLVASLETVSFDVSADHSMFRSVLKIDILPSLLIRVHDTVKMWAAELAARVNEYIGYHISKHIGGGARRGAKVRPWTSSELKTWAEQLQRERNLQAGRGPDSGSALSPGNSEAPRRGRD